MSVTGVEEEEDEGDGIGRVEVEATGGGTGTYVLPPSLPATSEWAVASNAQRRGANAR